MKKKKEILDKETLEVVKVIGTYAGILGGVKLLQDFVNRDVV